MLGFGNDRNAAETTAPVAFRKKLNPPNQVPARDTSQGVAPSRNRPEGEVL